MIRVLCIFHSNVHILAMNRVLAGIFAPFNATPLMTQVLGALRLKEIKRLLVVDLDLDMPEFHDSSVIRAIRVGLN